MVLGPKDRMAEFAGHMGLARDMELVEGMGLDIDFESRLEVSMAKEDLGKTLAG
jgi:hypothetical protein